MQIAILGAGFCGLATAWHLTQKGMRNITIFDPHGIGQGASGISAGLLHSFAGTHAKKNPQADQGMAATLNLIAIAEKTLGSPIICSQGLVRLAHTEEQMKDYALTAARYPSEVRWLSQSEVEQKLGIPCLYPGIFIQHAFVIDSEKYLKGLWIACANEGVVLEKKKIHSLEEIKDYDRIIAAMGADSKKLPELSHLKLTRLKGQILDLDWPESIPPFQFPVSSQSYLIMKEGNRKCIAGATFERNFLSDEPDIDVASKEILPKIHTFLPQLTSSLITNCRSGVRASTPNHLPYLEKINDKTWLLTGMGSKGLLYHALYAENLTYSL